MLLNEYKLVCPGHVFSSTTDNVATNFLLLNHLICHLLDLSLSEVYKCPSFKGKLININFVGIFSKTKKLSNHFRASNKVLVNLCKIQLRSVLVTKPKKTK